MSLASDPQLDLIRGDLEVIRHHLVMGSVTVLRDSETARQIQTVLQQMDRLIDVASGDDETAKGTINQKWIAAHAELSRLIGRATDLVRAQRNEAIARRQTWIIGIVTTIAGLIGGAVGGLVTLLFQ